MTLGSLDGTLKCYNMDHPMKGIMCLISRDPSDLMEDGKTHTLLEIMWHLPNNNNYFPVPFAALVSTEECAKFYDATLSDDEGVNVLNHQSHIIETLLLNLDEIKNSTLQGHGRQTRTI